MIPPCSCERAQQQRRGSSRAAWPAWSASPRSWISGSDFCSAGPGGRRCSSPSVVSASEPRPANFGVPVTNVLMSLAAPPSASTLGRNAVEKSPRLFIVGTSSRRNCGSSRKFSSSAALSSAVAVAVVADELMKPRMRRRSRASGASALSPLTASVASVLFCCGEERSGRCRTAAAPGRTCAARSAAPRRCRRTPCRTR